ncbi:HlyD family secretion protein [Mangrovimonas aestuarii]|uniref:HlyD family secretion protein n=1 Tax=Mangrovimonas aestuarii TaxID=3018443 RepID=UPI002379E4D0|nr:HlyD family efflux transporter periplasmic adaptor subunit [Mangrovimonas aestuarii]
MLNISNNSISKYLDVKSFKSGEYVMSKTYYPWFKRFLLAIFIVLLVALFLPWTQNVRSDGYVTTLYPDQRPQTIQSPIPGRIEQWYVREGEFVKKGDTILRVSEIKSEYFDERLAERTSDQVDAKSFSVGAYKNKVAALRNQIKALKEEQKYKLEQARNKLEQAHFKVKSDSMDLVAMKTNAQIADSQFKRTQTLQNEGLKSVRELEDKQAKLQEAKAKLVAQQNKLLSSKNDLINAELNISTIKATYSDKLAKAESDLFSAQSSAFDTEAQVLKLQTNLANYQRRSSLQYITAPQDGFINKAIVAGIGETIKEGQKLVGIMPSNYQLAVEIFVKPIDLPLIHNGEKVRVQFDGWPAIVFSGWPNASYGTYGAEIVAIENYTSDNGYYRVLVAPDPSSEPWPKEIRVGSGAKTMALLNDVPIWFELWRQINSFPPNYYKPKIEESNKNSKDKE